MFILVYALYLVSVFAFLHASLNSWSGLTQDLLFLIIIWQKIVFRCLQERFFIFCYE